ncbi:hypothetical protein [Rhodobacter capsulatus]|jgi:predicted small lipoprotein YifL|uniref:Lipoprotein, putative n=1 Tax=Rhodobacter capsulatus (strain ATCC BAA-309 / NBRC 16581 / SB1003) TaxID=272942 RepID=D5AR92_RHOCB|nr:hypothetical protein [Rhodobacter capsulatus]ADE86897.1 lipoprotein, putative [Rhodobacter capsulatus SB 1003]ETD00430.1 argininosuccinate lyase [Rhodobacter capsulatus DE442]ETD74770.1 argininosuccinate lyase [Rhodobacter capsulatus R121]ETD80493.1 argininosuccinate lyase [Rhodobacter capsulatus B6]ETD80776.1 argininosuccinate lyase [Rhodobacter capsulatus YW1]
MRILLALSVLTFVAACGVDGPPTPPQSTTPGLSITGEARMGVAGRL